MLRLAVLARALAGSLAMLAYVAAPGVSHSSALFASGPDVFDVGRQFADVSNGVAGSTVALGDGSVAYNGGLIVARPMTASTPSATTASVSRRCTRPGRPQRRR